MNIFVLILSPAAERGSELPGVRPGVQVCHDLCHNAADLLPRDEGTHDEDVALRAALSLQDISHYIHGHPCTSLSL